MYKDLKSSAVLRQITIIREIIAFLRCSLTRMKVQSCQQEKIKQNKQNQEKSSSFYKTVQDCFNQETPIKTVL